MAEAPIETYDIGDRPKLNATFRDPDTNALVDPATVVCTVHPPNTTKAEALLPTVTKLSKGKYQAEVDADRSGDWWYAFDAAGSYKGSEERYFIVRTQRVAR